jgi:SAM-dependent methyltransferase
LKLQSTVNSLSNKKGDDDVADLYRTDEYIRQNPSLHEEDSPWKIEKTIPLVDTFIGLIHKDRINLLDVGGGAGLILAGVSSYIEEQHRINVRKYALDLSPGMLEIQKQRNPQLVKALNEDIRCTTLHDKEIDLALLIDLLEHVPDPVQALEEIKRVSCYAIFKVPLDAYLVGKIGNFIKRGEPRRQAIEQIGHVNMYTYSELKAQIEKHTGHIVCSCFTNTHEYYLNSPYYKDNLSITSRLLGLAGVCTFRFSPRLAAFLFYDFAMFLVKCY